MHETFHRVGSTENGPFSEERRCENTEDKRIEPTQLFQGEAICFLETVGELSPPGTLEVGGSLGKFQVSCVLLLAHRCEARLAAPLFSLPEQLFCLGEYRFVFSLQLYLL